jgi:hypothetical protein
MITKETCVKIWNCHNEIEKSKKLIEDMAKVLSNDESKKAPTLDNAFGERRGLQMGVPSGNDSHYLYNVNIDLGVKIIEAHIKQNEERLIELMAIAKIELNG